MLEGLYPKRVLAGQYDPPRIIMISSMIAIAYDTVHRTYTVAFGDLLHDAIDGHSEEILCHTNQNIVASGCINHLTGLLHGIAPWRFDQAMDLVR
jgi:hypothetical protein